MQNLLSRTAGFLMAGILLTGIAGCGISVPFIESEETAYDAGMTLLDSREYREALARFEAARSQGEDSARLYRGIGIADFYLGDYEGAEAAFRTALADCGGIPNAMSYDLAYYLADTYRAQDRTEEAIGIYDAILDLKPREKIAHYLRGMIYLRRGDHESALKDFQVILDERPRPYDQILSIYEALSRSGYAAEGKGILEDILADSADTMTNYEKGRFYYSLGDSDSAKRFLEEANNDSSIRVSDKIPIVILLGEVEQNLGDDAGAISTYRRFLQEDQSQASIYNALGACEMRMGSYSDALTDFQIGLSLDDASQNPAILRNMAAVYEYMGNFDVAAQRMEEYLKLVPTDEEALRENIFLTTRRREAEENEESLNAGNGG
ncbi:MAG: tetratricopeptide repeat protein [Lachnospiraceae bacterium]|nr:tetratricopeptide repeat protein [Lachnospiraceae bacterium]